MLILLLVAFFLSFTSQKIEWTVIGAGPAGIAAITVLLESGVAKEHIAWVDPVFNVGHLSAYPEVPANTPAADFVDFFKSSPYFKPASKLCNKLVEQKSEPYLKDVIMPLQCITFYLKNLVNSYTGFVTKLEQLDTSWSIHINGKPKLSSDNVILATGSYPTQFSCSKKTIPLEVALNKDSLAGNVDKKDLVVVFGGSHSAVLVLKFLSEIGVENIINVYKHDLVYCDFSFDPPVHQGSGLKGIAARWAKENLETNPLPNLKRIKFENLDLELLQQADKIIYAVGFKPNSIEGLEISSYQAGELAPRLFGMGIAFPETIVDQSGSVEQLIGLDSFITYARKTIPNLVQKRFVDIERYYMLQNILRITYY